MTKIGDSLIRDAKEALEIAKGKLDPAGASGPGEKTENTEDASDRSAIGQVPSRDPDKA